MIQLIYTTGAVLVVTIVCLTILVAGGLRGISVTTTFRWKGEAGKRAPRKPAAAPAEASSS